MNLPNKIFIATIIASSLLFACNNGNQATNNNNATDTNNKSTINNNIEDVKWQLIALNNEAINGNAKTHFIRLDKSTGMANAMANCNTINMKYTLASNGKLSFKDGITTQMACIDDSIERKYVNALNEIDSFYAMDNELKMLNTQKNISISFTKDTTK
jgi:heat shock protein HslJ